MKPCPNCGHCDNGPHREETKQELMDAVLFVPLSIGEIAERVGRSYMTVAPLLRALAKEGKLKRTGGVAKNGKRSVYHYARQSGTDNP